MSGLWGLKTISDNRGKSLVKVEEMYENNYKSNKTSVIDKIRVARKYFVFFIFQDQFDFFQK